MTRLMKYLVVSFRIFEDDNVATMRRLKMVGELIDDKIITVLERRHHRCTGDDEWLRDECTDRNDDRKRDDSEFEDLPEGVDMLLDAGADGGGSRSTRLLLLRILYLFVHCYEL